MSLRTFFALDPKVGEKYTYRSKKGSDFNRPELDGLVLLCTKVMTDLPGNIYANYKVVSPNHVNTGEEICLLEIEILHFLHPLKKNKLKGRRVV